MSVHHVIYFYFIDLSFILYYYQYILYFAPDGLLIQLNSVILILSVDHIEAVVLLVSDTRVHGLGLDLYMYKAWPYLHMYAINNKPYHSNCIVLYILET
jgi:hypothetical protein